MLFSNLDEASDLSRRIFFSYFLCMIFICEMLIRARANVWYNLEHHTVRRNDYTTRESNVCEFFGFQNPIFNASFGDILKIKDLQIFKF